MTENLNKTNPGEIPFGYRPDSFGRLTPSSMIKPLDLLRDDTVLRIIANGRQAQSALRAFKQSAQSDIAAFLAISAGQYGVKMGGRKGNLQLTSFDGKYKVLLAVSENLVFDERLHIAKQLVDDCIHEWVKGSNDHIRALVEHAFQTDKQGNINTARIFSLMRLKIDDADWQAAMEALRDSIQITSTSEYIRLYERVDGTDKYRQIVLDMGGV